MCTLKIYTHTQSVQKRSSEFNHSEFITDAITKSKWNRFARPTFNNNKPSWNIENDFHSNGDFRRVSSKSQVHNFCVSFLSYFNWLRVLQIRIYKKKEKLVKMRRETSVDGIVKIFFRLASDCLKQFYIIVRCSKVFARQNSSLKWNINFQKINHMSVRTN